MTTPIGLTLLNTFKEPLIKASKDLKDEFLQLYNNGLADYIDNYYDKFSKTKTFIYRDEKVNFYDTFFPVTIRYKNTNFNSESDLTKIFEKKKFITIIGSAGSGKSMLTKHIFLSTVNKSYRIPIVLELRNLTDYDGNIKDYITLLLAKNHIGKNSKIIDRILKDGKFLFLFDGYDEIYSSAKNRITNDIEEFVDEYSKNIFVITSRPGSNAESLQRFDNFYVQSLNMVQIESFVSQQFKFYEDNGSIDRILSIIKKPENDDYKDYLTNPLLLSMFIFTFNAYPELPKQKNKFYWNVFDTLCTKHDSFTKKGFWLHERKSNLQNDDFENILKWFSYATIFKGKYNFDYNNFKILLTEIITKLNLNCNVDDLIYDLTVSISIIIQDGIEYKFPHKSLQEYFTASLIKGLDEILKEKVYSEKFSQLETYSTGGKINLYKLCYEMDKSNFTKYFLIPHTEKFFSKINQSSEKEIIKTYMNVFSFNLIIIESKKDKINAYSQNFYIEDSFLEFYTNDSFAPTFEEMNSHVSLLLPYFEYEIDNKTKSLNLGDVYVSSLSEFESFMKLTLWDKKILNLNMEIFANYNKMKGEIERESLDTEYLLEV